MTRCRLKVMPSAAGGDIHEEDLLLTVLEKSNSRSRSRAGVPPITTPGPYFSAPARAQDHIPMPERRQVLSPFSSRRSATYLAIQGIFLIPSSLRNRATSPISSSCRRTEIRCLTFPGLCSSEQTSRS